MQVRLLTTTVAALAVAALPMTGAVALPAAASGPAIATASADGRYVPLNSARLFDSRGVAFQRLLAPGETVNIKVAGRGGVASSGVQAVVVNLTVTGPTKAGNLVAWARGAALPNASSVNFAAGDTRANVVTVPVSSDGWINVRYAPTGSTNVIIDVQGYYLKGTGAAPTTSTSYFPQEPWRLVDTRDYERVEAGATYVEAVDYGDDGNRVIEALALNVTVVNPQRKGYLGVWDADGFSRETSTVNFAPATTTANTVIVPVTLAQDTDTGKTILQFLVRNASDGTLDYIIDVVGVYATDTDGLVFRSAGTPRRIVDSRFGTGTTALGTKTVNTVNAPSTVANASTVALATNVTLVGPTAPTYVTAYASAAPRPRISNLNAAPGQTVANGAAIELNGDNRFALFNNAGRTDVIVDVAGRFDALNVGTARRSAGFTPRHVDGTLARHIVR